MQHDYPRTTILDKYSQPAIRVIEQPLTAQMAMDVYGMQIEPICNYRNCHHKFSVHGYGSQCKCHHATNYAAGISYNQKYRLNM
jgi:hypothetical protein